MASTLFPIPNGCHATELSFQCSKRIEKQAPHVNKIQGSNEPDEQLVCWLSALFVSCTQNETYCWHKQQEPLVLQLVRPPAWYYWPQCVEIFFFHHLKEEINIFN